MSDRTAILRGLAALALARAAGCAAPASPQSAGAAFLAGVRDDFADRVDDGLDPADDYTTGQAVDEIAGEWATNADTRQFWAVFTELAAYREDRESGAAWPTSLESAASIALEQIAARLCRSLAALTTPAAGPLIAHARELLEDGPGAADPEYARGIVELVTRTLGLTSDGEPTVVAALFPEAGA